MSQVLRWVDHPDLPPLEQLLVHIANLRTPTAEHLATLMNNSKEYTVTQVSRLNKKGEMVRSMRLTGLNSPKIYYLGKMGCQAVEDITGMRYVYHEFSRKRGQGRHNKGVNDILMRMIQTVSLKEIQKHCRWWNTRGAKQEVFQSWQKMEQWSYEDAEREYKEMLSPDARFSVGQQSYWIEFDNDTKDQPSIWSQYQLYVTKLVPIDNHDPVVWVCKDEHRRDEMKEWWEQYRNNPPNTPELQNMLTFLEARGKKLHVPEMYFFAQGEETKPLLTGRL